MYIDEVPSLSHAEPNQLPLWRSFSMPVFFLSVLLQGMMDRTLALLQNADPATQAPDAPELIQLEGKKKKKTPNEDASLVSKSTAVSACELLCVVSL